ncbi:UDP-N-acetylmuramate dehydrogenase [Bacillaceae bacterium SIJ1]|uniref:UDP-N-acetylmuramate dehydrogenase n=1 Tax=Litoribacterium kuwaitense TaxID=1398745 RepID=UPI0013EA897D|nr:UDP-N-acetylmuramate dehydrogenase [Litoribacterium kuwaitense]NGP44342.1 UDP-N-acetylmuramate dehydrogenase [Litoribacterium kuwaitense]
MKNLAAELEQIENASVRQDEPLSKHTTIRIGGPAEWFVIPHSIEALKQTVAVAKAHQAPIFVIGRGSNLLVPDEGLSGVVIKLGKGLDHYKKDGNLVTVGGGYPFVKLAVMTSRDGLSGFEFAGGIPGSVGGAVYMNAGAHGSDVSRVLKEAHILFADGTMEWLSNEEMKFSYRTTVLQKERPGICLEARFQLKEGNAKDITNEMKTYKTYRKNTQPYDSPCAGSIFRNPLPSYSGELIEKAGLKGFSIGGAQVSPMHANFIVNIGDAKAEDVKAVIRHVQDTIFEKTGIQLQTEIEIIGTEVAH